jgi:hypothetical protein
MPGDHARNGLEAAVTETLAGQPPAWMLWPEPFDVRSAMAAVTRMEEVALGVERHLLNRRTKIEGLIREWRGPARLLFDTKLQQVDVMARLVAAALGAAAEALRAEIGAAEQRESYRLDELRRWQVLDALGHSEGWS